VTATLEYKPDGDVLKAFMRSDAFFRGLRGPVGSGKSVACCIEIFRRALQQEKGSDGVRRTRWAVIRNTNPQLKTTTIKTWLEWFPEDVWGKFNWSPPYTHHIRKGDLDVEVVFLALDRPEDVKKLLSFEVTGIWVNEAREIPKSIIDACTMRVDRYPSRRDVGATWAGVFCDTNAPEEDHWWPIMSGEAPIPEWMGDDEAKMMVAPHDWEFYTQPPGMKEEFENGQLVRYVTNRKAENKANMPKFYYNRIIEGKAKSWIDVYVMNRLGAVLEGKPVYEQFVPETHVAKEPVEIFPGHPVYIGLDFGLTPAATFGQKVRGRWLIQDELVSYDMGIVRFSELLREKLMTRFAHAGDAFIFGDPAGDTRAQTDESTPFQILRAAGLNARPTHTNGIDVRLEAVNTQLTKMAEGRPGFMIDARCINLIRGFSGGYCYQRVQVSGEKYRDLPDKGKYSHVHDALQYMMLGAGEGRDLMRRTGMKAGVFKAKTRFNPFVRA